MKKDYKKTIIKKAQDYSPEKAIESDWSPIQKFFSNKEELVSKFKLVGKSLTDNGVVIFNYKNNSIRKFLHLDTQSNAYADLGKDRFQKITREEAVKQAL